MDRAALRANLGYIAAIKISEIALGSKALDDESIRTKMCEWLGITEGGNYGIPNASAVKGLREALTQ